MRVLSVDLGTSNTVAVLSAHGRPPRVVEVDGSATMPSAVFASEDGGLVVGRDAERRARLDPSRFEPNPKRRVDEGTLLLGDTVVPVTDSFAAVLRRVTDETSRQLGGARPDEVRLTHPAQWGPVRRNVLLAGARLAGMGSNLVLVPEPVAAAAHFASFPGQSLAPGKALAVYDLGAGTFDIAVVGATQHGFTVLAEDGLPDLGGLDVDQALLEHVGRQVSHRDPGRWQRLLRPETTGDRRAQRVARGREGGQGSAVPAPADRGADARTVRRRARHPRGAGGVDPAEPAAQCRAVGGHHPQHGHDPGPARGHLPGRWLQPDPAGRHAHRRAPAGRSHQPRPAGDGRRPGRAPRAPGGHQHAHPGSGERAGRGPADDHDDPGAHGRAPGGPRTPTSGAFPVQQQGFPPSGPIRTPLPNNFPTTPPVGTATAKAPASPRKKPNRKLLIGLGALVVVILVAVGAIFLLPTSGDVPSAQDCQSVADRDAKGFTKCLRQLAGGVPDASSSCTEGPQSSGIDASAGLITTCTLADNYQVTYLQANSATIATAQADKVMNTLGGDQVQADWKGNGLTGKYSAAVSGGSGRLVFTVQDRPILGVLSKTQLRDNSGYTPATLADYFEASVQPGT
ncbi:hypothetical protein GCM10029964_024180 [Kibdelosporangium lantanae]